MKRPLAAVGVVAGAALALTGLQAVGAGSAHANPAGTGVVISEVFTNAASLASPYDADFVELYNPTADDIPLSGLSLQIRQADDTVVGTVPLTDDSVPAGRHFLVQLDPAGTASTTHLDLPTADMVASPALSTPAVARAAEVILGHESTYGTGDLAGADGVTDAVGFAAAASYEGASVKLPTGVVATYNSVNRTDTGADTDDNAADFTWAGPTPTASATAPAARATATFTDTKIQALPDGAFATSKGQAVFMVAAAGDDGTPLGTVQLSGPAGFVSDEAALGAILPGKAVSTFGTAGLAPGDYDLTGSYKGDATYAPTTFHVALTLEAGDTASTVSATDANLSADQPFSRTITVASAAGGGAVPTGVVSIWQGDTNLTAANGVTLDDTGAASVTIPYESLAPGANTLVVKYSGDATYAQSSKTITVTTPAVDSTTTVTAPSVTVGTAGHASVKVAAADVTPSGKVTLTGAGDPQTKEIDANGNVSFDLPATLAAGAYTLSASYAGDPADRILASSGTATFTVAAASGGSHVVTPPTAAQQKLTKDRQKLAKAHHKLKKAKKAHHAKKVKKLKKKVKKLKKKVKKDKKLVKAGK